ncbi:MAG: M15 family metallopeptidase [Fimbriimonadaceae bacterium]|nr:M15 family metallopeptidase [Chitinophagales bacterium]
MQIQVNNFIAKRDNSFSLQFNFATATTDFLTGKMNYYTDINYTEIPKHQAYREDMYLLKDTYYWFNKMYDDAKKDGITLKIVSASRTFDEQKNLWEDKWKKNRSKFKTELETAKHIMQYNSMPGISRHHWGTEIDINSINDSYFKTEVGKKTYNWLTANAAKYGFCQTYDDIINRTGGYKEEKWHWSFYPISNTLLNLYNQKVNYTHIKGFSGAGSADEIDVIKNYVLAINNECAE